jgi:ATP-binding cassette subfamily B protein
MTAGGVLELIWYTEILFRSLERLTREMEDFQRAGVSIGRIDELRRWSTTITARLATTGERTTLDVTGPLRVTFDDVTFGYDPEEPVLHDINLEIAPGRVFGLLGRTGSGKTTISRLLFRLYDVQRGEILIDGADIRTLEPEALRHRLGIVTQSVQLFRGTVRDNLTFFDRSIPDSHIDDVVDPWASPNGSRPCPKASTRSCKAATVVCRPGKRSCWCSPACSSRIPVS